MPPEGQSGKDPIVVATLPTDDEIRRLAWTLHQARQPVVQEVDGWIVVYRPASRGSLVPVDLQNNVEKPELAKSFPVPAWFEFGLSSSWGFRVSWDHGEDEPPRLYKPGENVVSESAHSSQTDPILDAMAEGFPFGRTDAPSKLLREGEIQLEVISEHERNPVARRLCIEHYGLNCVICGFNFADKYGEMGAGIIHVHHLRPISEATGDYEIDPIRDLRPVCPNCHVMLHRRTPPYCPDELRLLLRKP